MQRASIRSVDSVDSLIQRSLRALDEEGKIPPREGFQRLVDEGLIDKRANSTGAMSASRLWRADTLTTIAKRSQKSRGR